MATLRKIHLTLIQIIRALKDILGEIIKYYISPYVFLITLKRLSSMNLNIRTTWRTKRRGRPPISDDIRSLIIEIKQLNPGWGGRRISDELKKIGFCVCKESVLKMLRQARLLNSPPHSGLSWSQFLEMHPFRVGIDFTSVFDMFGRQYFIFVILDLETRALLHINTTLHPDRQWVTQHFRDAFFDFDLYPTLCVSDRDSIYGRCLKEMLKSYYDTELIRIPYKQPWRNGRVERFHLSLKTEAFWNFAPISQHQIQRRCSQYKKYYNNHRCHQALAGNRPGLHISKSVSKPTRFSRIRHLGGSITTFEPTVSAAA